MPDIPYKYLKDENWDTFYPITGPSSVNGQIPVANGGTGADTAAGARANLGAVSAQDVTLYSQPNDFVVSVSEGGTGATTAAGALTNLGVTVVDYRFTVSFSAGTIGTRGAQYTIADGIPSGKKLISAVVYGIQDSSTVIPILFGYGSALYLNAYRATTSAVSSNIIDVRFTMIDS